MMPKVPHSIEKRHNAFWHNRVKEEGYTHLRVGVLSPIDRRSVHARFEYTNQALEATIPSTFLSEQRCRHILISAHHQLLAANSAKSFASLP